MQLWTEYEGQTIDGAFLLEKLLVSEGRSAFYEVVNGDGVHKLLRLIASHFDEDEILARWRGIDALNNPNTLKIERYGQVTLDETTMVYAIFEPTDASLADVVATQRLTGPDAKQLAVSLASALQVLHANGFVHEHVEPSKVFAVGEVVKLRGDCIRETPEGEAGIAAKKKDVHDLAVVVLLALAGTDRLEEATRVASLPAAMLEVIRKAWSGEWGLAQILTALGGEKSVLAAQGVTAEAASAQASQGKESPEGEKKAAVSTEPGKAVAKAEPVKVVARPEPVSKAEPIAKPEPIKVAATTAPAYVSSPAVSSARRMVESSDSKARFAAPGSRESLMVEEEDRRNPLFTKWAALIAVVGVLVIWLIVHSMRARPGAKDAASTPAVASSAAASQTGGGAGPVASKGLPSKPSASRASGKRAVVSAGAPAAGASSAAAQAGGGREQWRVVSFTYNRQDQAQHKVDTIVRAHPELRAEVFSPTGRAPYLVTVGGVMSRDKAFALAQRVRGLGLPRDSYAQNYSGKGP